MKINKIRTKSFIGRRNFYMSIISLNLQGDKEIMFTICLFKRSKQIIVEFSTKGKFPVFELSTASYKSQVNKEDQFKLV